MTEPIPNGEPGSSSPNDPYGFIQQKPMSKAGLCYDIGTDLRLFCLAIGRANNTGHARFDPGELSRKLAHATHRTGEIKELDPSNVSRAIGRLARAGLVSPESTPRCVLLRSDIWSRRRKSQPPGYCDVHGTRAGYGPLGWNEKPAAVMEAS